MRGRTGRRPSPAPLKARRGAGMLDPTTLEAAARDTASPVGAGIGRRPGRPTRGHERSHQTQPQPQPTGQLKSKSFCRVRFSSEKYGKDDSATAPSQILPASSPRAILVRTGPKNALPSMAMVGVPTS